MILGLKFTVLDAVNLNRGRTKLAGVEILLSKILLTSLIPGYMLVLCSTLATASETSSGSGGQSGSLPDYLMDRISVRAWFSSLRTCLNQAAASTLTVPKYCENKYDVTILTEILNIYAINGFSKQLR